jgi:hypothetical protein
LIRAVVVADEIKNSRSVLSSEQAQATAQLLQEDCPRFRWSQEEQNPKVREIDSLVEEVDCECDLKLILPEFLD